MGFIRGGFLVLVCILIFFSLLAGNILWTISSSMQYKNIQPRFVSLASDFLGEQLSVEDKLGDLNNIIETYCGTNTDYNFDYGDFSVSIPCDVLSSGTDETVSYVVGSLFDEYYYKEYDCEFWNCFGDDVPLFLISQKAQNYWAGKFRLALLISAALAALILLLAEKKSNAFILVGSLTAASSLLLLKIDKLAGLISGAFGDFGDYASDVVGIFFTQSNVIFTRVILIGVALLIIGIVMKIFHFGVWFSNFIGRFRKGGKKAKSDKEEVKGGEKEKKVSKKKK